MSCNVTLADKSYTEFTKRSKSIIAVETTTLLLLSLTAVGGNLLVIISFCRNPSLRTITNRFIVSQAVVDFLFQLTVVPLTLVWSVKSRFAIGHQACEFQAIAIASSSAMSILNLTSLAINRYVCVCKSQKYKKLFNKRTFLSLSCAIWSTPLAFILLVKFGSPLFGCADFKPHRITCLLNHAGEDRELPQRFGNVMALLLIVLPAIIIVYCYFHVFKTIHQHKRSVAPTSSLQNTNLGTSPQDIKITWTLFAVLIGYIATWVPMLVITSLIHFKYDVPHQGKIFMTYTAVCSNAINPIIYGALNPAFRREFVKMLLWK